MMLNGTIQEKTLLIEKIPTKQQKRRNLLECGIEINGRLECQHVVPSAFV